MLKIFSLNMFKTNTKYTVIGALMLMSFDVNDSNFESYTQKIPGTEVAFQMTPIPEGTFMMGSENSADEKPVHEVKIAPFWMGTHEVTWDAFELFLDKNYELAISEGPIGEIVGGLTIGFI